jgi:ferredoxin-nitrate reductase
VDYAAMGDQGWQPPTERAALRRAFARIEPALPPRDPEYPLVLLTGRLLYDRGTFLSRCGRIQNLVPDASVVIHPADARKLGVDDGDDASVVSAKGRLGLTVRVSDEIMQGAAFAPLNLSEAPLSVLYEDRWTLPRVRIVK